tara:strand:+ start:387 stop:743 length:357 start_codon:yes stop_codon:yes gene_type:complete
MNPLQENLDKIEEETIKEIEEQFRFESHQRHLENVLITYIKGYEKKQYRMQPIFIDIRKRLEEQEQISAKQFESILNWVKRESRFKSLDEDGVYKYFLPIISRKKVDVPVSNLTEFLH